MDIFEGLNSQQKEAVCSENQHILVIAGAGSGKTRVLVRRLAWLMEEKNISPHNIMAVTFTNKAANEMKDRVEDLTGINTRWMWIGTFHSICSRLLRMEADNLGIARDFVIYDDADSRALIKRCLIELGLGNREKEYHPSAVLGQISAAKNMLIRPDSFAIGKDDEWTRNIGRVYARYQEMLRQANAFDFDDLLTQSVWLLEKHPLVLEKYRERFKHILVDEYQDTNHCQYRFIRLLAGTTGNIFAVGDPDQSIYKWRGADISNILDFPKDYPDCVELPLTRNYRSTQNILDAANAVIANNRARKDKNLFTDSGCGEKLIYYRAGDDREEANYVIRSIVGLLDSGYSLSDCAVLFRTHGQSRLFEDECIRYNINYRVYGGIKFYERKEVKDSLAYLRLLSNPYDTEALRRIYNEPKRGIGKATWDKLEAIARQKDIPLWDVLNTIDKDDSLGSAARKKLIELASLLNTLRKFAAEESSIATIIDEVWRCSGYSSMIAADEQKEAKSEIMEQFYDTAIDFDRYYAENYSSIPDDENEPPLVAFLGQLALATDMDNAEENPDYLTLMTLHSAKGLEFPVIFLVGMEEGVFPHKKTLFSFDDSELEEERRLCYVGMTRAKERLILTGAMRRQLWGHYESNKTSRFIAEIPPELIQRYGAFSDQSEPYRQTKKEVPMTPATVFVAAKPIEPEPKKKELINVGDKLRHAKFGDGVVVKVNGSGDDMILEIAFPHIGIKKLIWKYAPVKKI